MPTGNEIRAMLRADVPEVVLGLLFVAIGLAAAALFRIWRRSKDPALLWFALFSGIYGARMLLGDRSVQFISGMPRWLATYGPATITYLAPIPGLMYLYEVFPAWRRVLRAIVYGWLVFSIAGIVSDQVLRRPESLGIVNNVLVLANSMALLLMLFRPGFSSTLARPIQYGVLLFYGTVVVNNLRALRLFGTQFNPEPLGFLALVISFGAVAARRGFEQEQRLLSLEQELDIARRIQASILPQAMPQTRGVDVSAEYLPMTAVAGDFYDFLVVDEHRLGILIADVSGHGVPAALIASMVKVAIAAQLPHAGDPACVLKGMNQIMCGKLHGQFVTAAYVFLDLKEWRLRYAAAGHPPMLRLRGASVEEIEENGVPLGLFAAASYGTHECDLAAGDRFLLYTDGLIEGSDSSGDQFGAARISETLTRTAKATPKSCTESLLDRLFRFTAGGAQEDDLTVIVADVK